MCKVIRDWPGPRQLGPEEAFTGPYERSAFTRKYPTGSGQYLTTEWTDKQTDRQRDGQRVLSQHASTTSSMSGGVADVH